MLLPIVENYAGVLERDPLQNDFSCHHEFSFGRKREIWWPIEIRTWLAATSYRTMKNKRTISCEIVLVSSGCGGKMMSRIGSGRANKQKPRYRTLCLSYRVEGAKRGDRDIEPSWQTRFLTSAETQWRMRGQAQGDCQWRNDLAELLPVEESGRAILRKRAIWVHPPWFLKRYEFRLQEHQTSDCDLEAERAMQIAQRTIKRIDPAGNKRIMIRHIRGAENSAFFIFNSSSPFLFLRRWCFYAVL